MATFKERVSNVLAWGGAAILVMVTCGSLYENYQDYRTDQVRAQSAYEKALADYEADTEFRVRYYEVRCEMVESELSLGDCMMSKATPELAKRIELAIAEGYSYAEVRHHLLERADSIADLPAPTLEEVTFSIKEGALHFIAIFGFGPWFLIGIINYLLIGRMRLVPFSIKKKSV